MGFFSRRMGVHVLFSLLLALAGNNNVLYRKIKQINVIYTLLILITVGVSRVKSIFFGASSLGVSQKFPEVAGYTCCRIDFNNSFN